MKNEVIKVLTREHGARVIQYWKDRGVDTREHLGAVSESNGNGFIYYGVIEGKFDNYSLQQVHDYNADVIELPNEEPVFKVGDKVYHFTHGWGIIDVLDSFLSHFSSIEKYSILLEISPEERLIIFSEGIE